MNRIDPATATYYFVPPGTSSRVCNGKNCTATVYFIPHPRTGRGMPIDCDVPGGQRPSAKQDPAQADAFRDSSPESHSGKGVLHFLTCPNADDFTRRKPR